ncbi:MAG: FAD/NAD(P)-binding protein, partial [Candidatus Dormibacteraceae bacterium]
MRIGIIGGGSAGCAAAVALGSLAKIKEAAVDLTIIERQLHNGGRSFSKDNPALTLNTSAGVTSVDADDPDGFVSFLNRHRDASPTEFAPRSEAADYLRYA